jgi:hypothetical protein
MVSLPKFSLHRTHFDFVLRYWKQQGTIQKVHWQEEVFIPRRVFLLKHVTSRSSPWATPLSMLEFIHSFIHYQVHL